jgi:hypothetical protein
MESKESMTSLGSLIWRNEAWRGWSKMALMSTAIAMLLLGIYNYRVAAGQPAILAHALPLLWLNAAAYLLFPQAGRRCREFDLALPFPAARLWRAHLAAILLATSSILGFGLVIILGFGSWLTHLPQQYAHTLADAVGWIPSTLSCLILAVAAISALQPHLHRIPSDRRTVIAKLSILVCGFGLTWLLGRWPWYAAVGPLAVAAAIAVRTARSLPPTLSILPDTPRSAGLPVPLADSRTAAAKAGRPGAVAGRTGAAAWDTAAWGSGRNGRFRWRLAMMILQALSTGPAAYIVALPLAFAFGVLLSGYGEAHWFDDELRFSLVPITSYLLLSFMGKPMGKFALLDYLPIPRRTILAVLMIPQVLAIGLGYGASRIALELESDHKPAILCRDIESACHVQLPLAFWKITWDGAPGLIESPWGETVEPRTLPILSGGRAVLYKPYTTAASSSPQFIAWQISRAVQAVYGEQIEPERIEARYLTATPEVQTVVDGGAQVGGGVRIIDKVQALLADHPDWKPRSDGPVFPVLMLLVGLLFLPVFWLYLGSFRADVSDGARKRTFWGLMILLLAVHMAQYILAASRVVRLDAVTALWHMLIRQFASPLGVIILYITAAVSLWLGYRAVLKRFEKIEAVSACDICL